MSPRRPIVLNAFDMNCVGHIHHGLWTHPRDRSTEYGSLAHWTSLARTLERGLFDGLFLADIIGVYDVYAQSVDLTLSEAVQLPVNDPWLLVSAMAAVTEHLGFGLTGNLSTDAPYSFARRVSTLDQLSGGRIGWNIVTGYLDSGGRALGLRILPDHDARYDQAEEYLELLYKLWEGSWEDGAVLRDKAARRYADPARVHRIRHEGRYYRSEGYHLSEPSPQRTPVLFQAGASARGQVFAARHAECVFIAAQEPAAARATVRSLRQAFRDAGRDPADLRILVGLSVVTAATQAEALDRYADYRHHASPEAGVAHFAASLGIDFARYALDEPITYGPTNAIQSAVRTAQRIGQSRRQLEERMALGSWYPVIVGDASHVADELARWLEEGEVDGFNLTRTVSPESIEDFIDIVVPALQDRGLHKTAYTPGTLREKLFRGNARLPASHVAAGFRHPSRSA